MQNKLTVSIIGAGNIAGGFDEKKISGNEGIFSHAGAYKQSGKFVLKSIFDVDLHRATEFKAYWDVANIALNEDEIIRGTQDIISICSPDRFHFQTLKNILLNQSCKTVFVEKPLGLTFDEIDEIYQLSQKTDINIIVNFQRHFDNSYRFINPSNNKILTANCYYIKGLKHIGITMVDTLAMLFGHPTNVYAYNRIYNQEIEDYTYEFILFYNDFNITIKTIDEGERYNYHLFDIDVLTKNGRILFTDNGNTMLTYDLSDYVYSGVKVLTKEPTAKATDYPDTMLRSIEYIFDITGKNKPHTVNTVTQSYNNYLLLDKIMESFSSQQKIVLQETLWKK